jgi:pyridoxine 5'-phosphate synthase PdxJ
MILGLIAKNAGLALGEKGLKVLAGHRLTFINVHS